MAGTCAAVGRHVIGPTAIELSRTTNNVSNRTGAPFSVRISADSNGGVSAVSDGLARVAEGPSCLFVGPIETASRETLEALYRQARNAYYSGKPLIVDDMFDRVELKLRWLGSKSVVKYPRCSLRRQSTYADAEEDPSQVVALASIWVLILAFGSSACLLPMVYTAGQVYQDASGSGISYSSQASSALDYLSMVNDFLFLALGSAIGYPIISASVGVLQGLWKNDLVALKGACPNCGEQVFAFVKLNQSNRSPHTASCHVCESALEFRTKVERSRTRLSKQWVYGRIFLVSQRGHNRRQR